MFENKTNPGFEGIVDDSACDAAAKIIYDAYKLEFETIIADPQLKVDLAGEAGTVYEAVGNILFYSFPPEIIDPCRQDFNQGELSSVIESVCMNLNERSPYYGKTLLGLFELCERLTSETNEELEWYYERQVEYLEKAHSAGAFRKEKIYLKLKSDLARWTPDALRKLDQDAGQ